MQTQIAPLKELESLRPFIATLITAAHASYHWRWTVHLILVAIVAVYRLDDLVGERARVKDRYAEVLAFRPQNTDLLVEAMQNG
jgi:hypothetical protein